MRFDSGRNLTDADIFRCVSVLDSRKDKGGDRKSEDAYCLLMPTCGGDPET